jgi:hypothetical protein
LPHQAERFRSASAFSKDEPERREALFGRRFPFRHASSSNQTLSIQSQCCELSELMATARPMQRPDLSLVFGAEAIINELSTALFAMMLRAYIETQALPAGALRC